MSQYPPQWNPNQGPGQQPGQYPSGPPQHGGYPGGYPGSQPPYPTSGQPFPPAPPQPNAYQTQLGQGPTGPGPQWGPGPTSPPPAKKINAKLIIAVVVALALVAAIGAGVGLLMKSRNAAKPVSPVTPTPVTQSSAPQPTPSPKTTAPTPTPTPTATATQASNRDRVQVYQNYSVAMPDGWNVLDSNPAKGYATLQYGQGKAWITVFVNDNSPPWDAVTRCTYLVKNWTERGADYGISNAAVTQSPTKVESDPRISVATVAMTAYYAKDVSNVRQYSWQGAYRVRDGLNIWVRSERVTGSTAPDADIQFVRDDVVKTILAAS